MDAVERCVLVKPEVMMYRIPPRQSARGYRAADWNLAAPDWTGRLRCMVKGSLLTIRLEDRGSNELFAACPVEHFPGMSVEPVTDSSRYFVICVKDDSGRKAYIGIGFNDRSDSFDLNVCLQDHFKQVRKEEAFINEGSAQDGSQNSASKGPSLDLAFKEGQTIRVNLNIAKKERPRGTGQENSGRGINLPPPPGSGGLPVIRPPPSSVISPSSTVAPTPNASADLLGLGEFSAPAAPASSSSPSLDSDPWGDFTSAPSSQTVQSGNWETF